MHPASGNQLANHSSKGGHLRTRIAIAFGICLASSSVLLNAQQTFPPVSTTLAPATQSVPITLDEAITRARANEPAFASAYAASRVAALDRSIARAALLPNAIYHNQYLYTQPADAAAITPTPRFIANNAVHEYTSQGVVNEILGLQQFTALSRASAAAAVASAQLEIARRGLVSTVVGLFYGTLAADRKVVIAQRAAGEASSFSTLTQRRESAREVAHADVIKALLQQQQRNRDLADATLLAQKARLDLAVLLFPDPRSPYTLTAPARPSLAPRAEVEAAAGKLNPELQSALASLRVSNLDIVAAKAAYLPDLGLNFAYGIDATQFAARGPDGVPNLGYSATATLDIPIWNWFSTQHKIRQSQILRDAARINLTATQRRLIAQLEEFYAEAELAGTQLQSLEDSVATALESLRLTRLRYTAGEATVLEVVDAQTSLTITELAHEDGTVRYQTALANLQMLTGTI